MKRPDLGRRVASVIAVCAVSAVILSASASVTTETQARPNVVFVMADDMRPDEMQRVADLRPGGGFDWIRDHGTQFTSTFSTDNLCCPGRMTALTGQTAFHHGQKENRPYRDLQNGLPSWLQGAGYCTAFTGKYFNAYTAKRPRPSGWDFWEPLTSDLNDETGYTIMKRDGTVWQPGDFITDHLLTVARSQMDACLDSSSHFS